MFSLPIPIHYHVYARKKEFVPLSLFTLRSGGDCGFGGKGCALLLKPKAGVNGKGGWGDVASHPYLLLPLPFLHAHHILGAEIVGNTPPSLPHLFRSMSGIHSGKKGRRGNTVCLSKCRVSSIPFVLPPLLNLMVKTEKNLFELRKEFLFISA